MHARVYKEKGRKAGIKAGERGGIKKQKRDK